MPANCARQLSQVLTLALVALIALGTPYAALAANRTLPAAQPGDNRQAEPDPDFTPIGDEAGIISVEVPAAWEDVVEDEWTKADEPVGIRLTAAPDVQAFYDDWGIPGVAISYSEVLPGEVSEEELLDTVDYRDACTEGERDSLPNRDLTGIYQVWEACGGTETSAIVAVLRPAESPDYYVLLEIYLASEGDEAALDRILASLLIGGPANTTASPIDLFEVVDTGDLEYAYVAVQDPAIVALVPEAYDDTESAVWENSDGEPLGFTYTAAPAIDEFFDTWTTPGLLVRSAVDMEEALDVDEMLKDEDLEELCTYDDRYTETHTIGDFRYDVAYDRYDNCGETDSAYIVMMAQTDPPAQLLFADFLIVDTADEEAFDVLLRSFYLDPALAGESTGDIQLVSITDETDTITVSVPEHWTEVESQDWDLGDGPVGVALTAAPELVGFDERWDVPGVFVGVSDELAESLTYDEMLDAFEFSDECSYDDRYEYATDALEGAYDVWLDCGEVEGNTFIALSAVPAGASAPMILMYMSLPGGEDVAEFDAVLGSLAVAGSVEAAVDKEQVELRATPLAIVQVDRLNVRSGPGTSFNRVGVVTRDTVLVVDGQIDNCAWLKVATPEGVEGWVSGSSDFVSLDTRCSEIPKVEAPAAAAPAAGDTAASSSATTGGGNGNQGCYLFVNGYGVELNITFTDSGGKGSTFPVPKDGSVEKCLAAGKYTYTLDAPPPWDSANGDFTVEAGDNVQLDLYPQR